MAEKKTKRAPNRTPEQSRAAILDATREELIESGWRKFSVDKVSRRAKASKQTIYRWWPAIGGMCVEAALSLCPPRSERGRDPVERIAELIAPLEQTIRVGSGHTIMRGALLAASDDKDAGESLRFWLKEEIRAPLRLILAEIAAKKVVRRDFDVDEAIDLLFGPIWHRLLIMRAPLPDGFSHLQAELLIRHLAP